MGHGLLVYFLGCIYTDGFTDWSKCLLQLKIKCSFAETVDWSQNDNLVLKIKKKLWGSIWTYLLLDMLYLPITMGWDTKFYLLYFSSSTAIKNIYFFSFSFFNPHPRTCFMILEREKRGERKGEKHWSIASFRHPD